MTDTRPFIVVVEDDAGMRRALQRLLRVSGFDTHAFESAEAFASVNQPRTPYCLVLDVQLPGASGPQCYERLGAHRPPAVFITSHDSQATRTAITAAGGHELLTKPFVARDLLDAIARAVARGSPP